MATTSSIVTRTLFASMLVLLGVAFGYGLALVPRPPRVEEPRLSQLWSNETVKTHLEAYSAGRIIQYSEIEVLQTPCCVAILTDERVVQDGIMKLPKNTMQFSLMVHKQYTIERIDGTEFAAVILRKPYALKLGPCRSSSHKVE